MELVVVTDKEHLERIIDSETCFLFPVLTDPKKHYCENYLSFLYGFTISSETEFLVGFNHCDIPNFKSDIKQIRTKLQHIVYKKKYLHFYEDLIDADLLYWLENGESIKVEINSCIDFFHRNKKDNSIIPIYKWIEVIREVKDKVLKLQKSPVSVIDSYNNLLNQLIKIEHAGLFCDSLNFPLNKRGNYERNIEYTEYNPYTLTGRPSNKFGGINYAALNKIDGSRERFVSRFEGGCLIEFDYQAFHINLIAKILKYQFPEDAYLYLSKKFFRTDFPSKEEILYSKELTFRQVYGGVYSEYKHIEYFSRLDQLLKKIERDNANNSVKSLLFGKPIKSTDNHIKTFNYLLQNLETEINSLLLKKLNDFLADKKTRLILYTYDSFLFDYSPEDGEEIIEEIKKILDMIGIKSRMKIGKNYHQMISAKNCINIF